MGRLLSLLSFYLADRVASFFGSSFKAALNPLVPHVRRIGTGILVIIGSVVAWLASLVFLLLGTFFYLSHVDNLMAPAFWTSLVAAFIGIFAVGFGLSLIRRLH